MSLQITIKVNLHGAPKDGITKPIDWLIHRCTLDTNWRLKINFRKPLLLGQCNWKVQLSSRTVPEIFQGTISKDGLAPQNKMLIDRSSLETK